MERSHEEHMIADNISAVMKNIEKACAKAGRDPDSVSLIAVSKTKPVEMLREAYDAGMRDFGENKVQEILDKMPQLPSDIRWHMIGHLQRNKVKYLIGRVAMIHSVDSVALAEQIEKESAKRGKVTDILLEVNAARETSKWGFAPENVLDAAREISALSHVRIRGLMTSAPLTDHPESNRPYFRQLRELLETLGASGYPHVKADTLSMGMTCDFEIAVEEGATIVRLGTVIFGRREPLGLR